MKEMIGRGYFEAGECRIPGEEEVPELLDDECVVFHEFFVAGLRFPVDPLIPQIFRTFKVAMHQLAPNSFCYLAKFLWACRSFKGEVDLDCFVRHTELHFSKRKVLFADDDETYQAKYGCYTFCPRRAAKGMETP